MSLLLTKPFSDRDIAREDDPAMIYAITQERLMRELHFRGYSEIVALTTLTERVAARDAGDVCHVCGSLVTWVDHLPPRDPGGAVRCFANVASIRLPGVSAAEAAERITLLAQAGLTSDDFSKRVI